MHEPCILRACSGALFKHQIPHAVTEAQVQRSRAEAHAGQALGQELPRPLGQPEIDRALEREHAFGE